MTNVLNLREEEERTTPSDGHDVVPPVREEPEEDIDDEGDEPLVSLAGFMPEDVSWEASTKPDALERRKEHIMLGILGFLVIAIAMWQRSFALVAIAGLTILAWEMHHRHGHHDVRVEIDRNGIGVNGRRHRFERFRSFHIQELPDGSRHLSVMPASALSPAIRTPLGEQDHERVRAVLSSYLVEDEHDIPLSELFLKS
jgi:hypothetical protein